jgi:alpha-methylacyl-CoA racemase
MPNESTGIGPLAGLRVVEVVSIGPGPHCAMLLADLGAEVLRIDRPEGNGWMNPVVDRGRHVMTTDLRTESGRDLCLAASDRADVLIEGMRPGVMERLGLGPEVTSIRNPRLVYARMTGWGQTGPLAAAAGHDINYIAITGALAGIGPRSGPSVPPLNLVGDFGGGSMLLAFGIMSALWERQRSGKGQVVDCAIVDGVASMMTMFAGMIPSGTLSMERGRRLIGGDAPFYRCYVCADGLEISVGALEPKFYGELIRRTGAPAEFAEGQYDEGNWLERSNLLTALFATKTRAQWCEMLDGTDSCFAPVLTLGESMKHLHMRSRQTYLETNGLTQAAPVPRFSRTPGAIRQSESGTDLLRRWTSDRGEKSG